MSYDMGSNVNSCGIDAPELNDIDGRQKLILCAGINRSGSSWLFNAVRLLHGEGGLVAHSAWIDEYQPTDPRPIHIVKVHTETPALEILQPVIFTTRRDLRDIAASLLRMGWAHSSDDILNALKRIRGLHEHWTEKCNLEIAYEDLVGHEAQHVESLARTCGVPIDRRKAMRVAAAVDAIAAPDSGNYDRDSLLHPGHRGAGRPGCWRQDLPRELAATIEGAHGDWLRAWGYF